jgi:type III restriction enzyme
VKDQGYLVPKKSVFNRIVGDSHLELLFARFLEDADDVASYTKNFYAVNFKIDYINATGDISNYIPDFIVKSDKGDVFIIETKGHEDLDDPLKVARLSQWCDDINGLQTKVKYDFVYVDEEGFHKYKPSTLEELVGSFREFK